MGNDAMDLDYGFEEEGFDPFADDVDDTVPTDEEVVDLPVMNERPERDTRPTIFQKERYGDAYQAINKLLECNPGRTPIFLAIIDACNNPTPMSQIHDLVEAEHQSNYDVYTAARMCAMLRDAGALESYQEESATEVVEDDGVEYLELGEATEPIWTATEEGLTVLAEHREGASLRNFLGRPTEEPYLDVYLDLLQFLAAEPRTKAQIDAFLDDDPRCQNPRRYAISFTELLEKREAVAWRGGAWTITSVGKNFLTELRPDLEL